MELAKEGMQFNCTDGGWHVHTSSDLAIPAHFESPPSQVFGRALVHVVLLCYVCERRPLSDLAMMTPTHPIECAIKQICAEMLCPSATFASCLRSVMHPGVTQLVTEFAYSAAETYGYAETENVFANHMRRPLMVHTHAHFEEVMDAIEQMGIQFVQTATHGHVCLPCGVFLACHPTDHVLLFVQLVANKADAVRDMVAELHSTAGCGHKALFDAISSFNESK